jgi:hypothetical protein
MFSGRKKQHGPQQVNPQQSVDESLAEGVPDHLEIPLRQWVFAIFEDDEHSAQRVALHLKLRVNSGRDEYSPAKFLAGGTSRKQLLDVIDTALRFSAPPPGSAGNGRVYRFDTGTYEHPHARRNSVVDALQDMLTLAGSAYRVNDARTGIELRVNPTVQQAVTSALATSRTPSSGSAADHLAQAWKSSYGRDPDPSKAYSEAIKAVESAAQAMIEPNNAKATLGSMLRVIGNSPQRFGTAISPSSGEDITLVADMMRRLWQGQTSRHGSQSPTRLETPQEAEMAVHLATTLVQWFASGAVHRVP